MNTTTSRSPVHSKTVCCPLCEGRGQLPEDVLVERLNEKDLANKIRTYLADFVDAEMAATSPKAGGTSAEISNLWRRSPKE
jgi:hypothetical protein